MHTKQKIKIKVKCVHKRIDRSWSEQNGLTDMHGHILYASKSTLIINPLGTLATLSLMYPRVLGDSDTLSPYNLHKDDIVEIVNMGVWDMHFKCICNSVLKTIPHPFETQMEQEPQEVYKVQNSFRLRKSMKI